MTARLGLDLGAGELRLLQADGRRLTHHAEVLLPEGAMVDFGVTTQDDCDPRPMVTCDFPPGTLFPPGMTLVTCTARDASGNRTQCSFEVEVACPRQVPGDCNQDGKLNISDPICLLRYFFGGLGALPCGDGTSADAANLGLLDWNGDHGLDISDVVSALSWLFLDGKPHVLGQECRQLAGCLQACR